jgi:GNAT superfamily N-acetyltransferase
VDIDAELIARLEASAAQAALSHVQALALVDPSSQAAGVPFGDGALIATGVGRYVNRALGVTLQALGPAELDEIEDFYFARGLDSSIELASWAPESVVEDLSRRGYEPAWFRAMFVMPAPVRQPALAGGIQIVRVDDENLEDWLAVLAMGNELDNSADRAISAAFARAGHAVDEELGFLVYVDGQAAACGSVQPVNGVAWIGAAATTPEFRSRGLQSTLVKHRAALAGSLDCDLVAATALPGETSARNLERLGLDVTHTQLVLTKKRGR